MVEKVIFERLHGFHVRTAAAAAVTWNSQKWYGFPAKPFEVDFIPRDDCNAAKTMIDSDTAAVIVEPVQGEPSRISKLNTALELLFLFFVLSHAGFGWPDEITQTVLGASILVTVVISGADYVWSWSRRAHAGGSNEV